MKASPFQTEKHLTNRIEYDDSNNFQKYWNSYDKSNITRISVIYNIHRKWSLTQIETRRRSEKRSESRLNLDLQFSSIYIRRHTYVELRTDIYIPRLILYICMWIHKWKSLENCIHILFLSSYQEWHCIHTFVCSGDFVGYVTYWG